MFKSKFEEIIKLHADIHRPLVAYTSIWPFLRHFQIGADDLAQSIIESLLKYYPNLLMPTFTNGYIDGVCNLDSAKSQTGYLSEVYRTKYNTIRTLSGFFSFAVSGLYSNELAQLQPLHAWGDNSLYHWLEQSDALAIMIGTHPTHVSYIHRIEWLYKDKISYRIEKYFEGTLIRSNKNISISENLFVRANNKIENDFTHLLEPFKEEGMKIYEISGIPISFIEVRAIKRICNEIINKNPLSFLKK